jgi:hypothetical protein
MVQQGEDGLPHVFQFNPASRQYEETGGLKLSGTASNQAFQGAAIQKLGSKIINDIQSNKELMGNLSSYATQYLNGTPISDPAAATLIADLESFSSTQPALHGFRSRTAQQAFSKILGGLANNPEATISTIEALSATASTFTNLATPEGPKTKELRSTAGGTIVQHSKSTGKYRYSTDGGKTWQPGQPQSQTTGKQ